MKGIKKGYKCKKHHARSCDHIFGPHGTDQLLQVRKSGPGEFSRPTGEFALRHCIKTQVHVHPHFSVHSSYNPVANSVLCALSDWVTPVGFHERITATGERFAYPESQRGDRLVSRVWRKCEKRMLRTPAYRWVAIDYAPADKPAVYTTVLFDDSEDEDEYPNPDFGKQLDAALAPYVIDDVDHPIARRLRQLVGDLAEIDAPRVWADIG